VTPSDGLELPDGLDAQVDAGGDEGAETEVGCVSDTALVFRDCCNFALVWWLRLLKGTTSKLGAFMFKFISRGLLAVSAIALSGCAGVPEFDIQSPVTVAHILDRIQCEAHAAAKDYPIFREEKWVGVADLFLQVDDNAGVTPTLSYVEPLVAAGTKWTLGVAGNLKRSRQRVYNETVTFDFLKLNGKMCAKPLVPYDLTGDLGIAETLKIAAESIDRKEDAVAFAAKEAVGQTVQFVLTRNVSGGPGWTLTHFVGGFVAGAERIDTHKLIVSFAPGAIKKVVVAADGKRSTVVTGGGGVDAAASNNSKLLLNSLQFQPFR
jgi:hypothetical protein